MSPFISLLTEHADAFVGAYGDRLSLDMRSAIHTMCQCKTGAIGCSQWRCEHCRYNDQLPLSCGHRHCPQCQHRATLDWLARQESKRLPVHYFMVTFTLPAELRDLARRQPRSLYSLMFPVAASVLKDFAKRQHGGDTGFTLVLHTHSRRRELHPHLHAVVPAGYYDPKRRQWHRGHNDYLYNEVALARVWRARILDAIAHHPQLSLPAKPLPTEWVVDCCPVGWGHEALLYLSRYLYRGVLPDKDIIAVENNEVTFRYRDGDTRQWRTRALPILKFLWLILQHVLPKGLKRVRDYGLLHSRARSIRLRILLMLLQTSWRSLQAAPAPRAKAQRHCPHCDHDMTCLGVIRTR